MLDLSRCKRSCLAVLAPTVVAIACGDATGPNEPATVMIAPASPTLNAIGDTVRLRATVLDGGGNELDNVAIEWKALSDAANVDATGRVVALDTGTVRVEARVDGAADTAVVVIDAAVPKSELIFLHFAADAPALETRDTSFWAVRGENRKLELHYASSNPGETGGEFLEFEVSGQSLLFRPDGTPFEEGDSVLIIVRVDDADRLLFTFEPSGLRFDPEHPAELEIEYAEADDDMDGDGDADAEDEAIERTVRVWQREQDGGLWFRVATARIEGLEEVEADVFGFTGFAIAGN